MMLMRGLKRNVVVPVISATVQKKMKTAMRMMKL